MTRSDLWEILQRVLRPRRDVHFELMSNETLDRWLQDHGAE